MRNRTRAAVALSLLTLLGATLAASPPAAAAPCSYTSCNGLDPEDTGCANGALDHAYWWGPPDTGGLKFTLRYSPACHAVWTKVEVGMPRDTDYGYAILSATGDGWGRSQRVRVYGYADEVKWTGMYSSGYTVKMCLDNAYTYGCSQKYLIG